MNIGFLDSRASFNFAATNLRSLADTAIEVQAEIAVKTKGSYTDSLGNSTVFEQRHVGAPTVRIVPQPSAVASTVELARGVIPSLVLDLSGVTYSESRITGNHL